MTVLIATRDWTPMMPVGVVSLTGALFVMRESVENIRKMWEFGRLNISPKTSRIDCKTKPRKVTKIIICPTYNKDFHFKIFLTIPGLGIAYFL